MVGRLLLETTLAINVNCIDENNNACFLFPKFMYVDDQCQCQIANLEIQVDLNKKEMVSASLGGEPLNTNESMTLVAFYIVGIQHVKLHSLANWSVNVHPSHKDKNAFHARNSIITVMYNYMGFTSFEKGIPLWIQMGILSKEWEGNTITKGFQHGIDSNVRSHANVRELFNHSELVRFVILTRSAFLEEFAKHKNQFPGCDGEALYVGTVLHSLEHLMYERILEDPFWFDVNAKRYVHSISIYSKQITK